MKYFCKRCLSLMLLAALLTGLLAIPAMAETMELKTTATTKTTLDALVGDEHMSASLEVTGSSWKRKVRATNWYKGGSSVLDVGSYGYLLDVSTGTVIHIKRCGGIAHADVEPASKKDTYKLWKLCNGFSWNRRAGILYASGRFIACSFNTKPHGKQTLRSNGFNGQFCLHMVGSKTHGSNKVDKDHMAAIKRAYYWAH